MEPGDYTRVSVTDDGTGIAPRALGQVFEPFFTTKEVGKGSGLGLSMVYGFAKQSRGHVKIYSELGHGTTVRMFLPRSRSAPAAEQARRKRAASRAARELVLVVEDDAPCARWQWSSCSASAIARWRRALRPTRSISLVANPRCRCCSRTWSCREARTVRQLARDVQRLRPSLPVSVHVRLHGERGHPQRPPG